MNLFLIAVGGALGSLLRYLSFEALLPLIRGSNYAQFPFHSLMVNIIGSLLAGVLYYFMISDIVAIDMRIRNFLLVGFLGGFTTFSAFSLDFFRLFSASQYSLAFIYVFMSFFMAILALFFGFYLMKIIFA